ncbi:MAG: hypothetical protein QOH69_3202, partial [Actinomycetota bacterium]|nr:hypothetical protein [Actinomycetota bacterium]
TDLGAVVTHVGTATSEEGFAAEWQMISLIIVEDDLISRCEVFDEADLDAALARFEELHPQARRLQNAASRADDRFFAYFGARDWAAIAEILADDSFVDDRRRVVNVGLWDGRDAVIANMRALAEFGPNISLTVMATRGARLALTRICTSNRDLRHGEFAVEMLGIVEIDTDHRIAAHVLFDPDDLHSAFKELDDRYLAGEAAAHAHMWSVIARALAAIKRHELPELTPDWVNIDHRRAIAFAPGEMTAYIHATLDDTPEFSMHIEAVHRVSNLGVVITLVSHGTSQGGFDAEWRMIQLLTVDGDLGNRCEIFDEADLDAALARFEELHPPTPRLENAASQVTERLRMAFAAAHWDDIAEILADNISSDDRRRLVSAGIQRGRDAVISELRTIADLGPTKIASTVLATRGGHLVLNQVRFSDADERLKRFQIDMLNVVEINDDNQIAAYVAFDPDDIDAAFEELESRYLAGEAAVYSHTWSVIADTYTAFNNRREMFPTTPDWVSIDHRHGAAFASGEMSAYIHAIWRDAPDSRVYIEAVHRLNNLGAVVTEVAHGTSQEGFEAEWRLIGMATVDRDLINRCEMFDEADLDTALARFEELQAQTRPLVNAASQVAQRFLEHFGACDWDAMADLLADDISMDDRRRVVNAGIRHGRDAEIKNFRAAVDLGFTYVTSAVIATRGERLALSRLRGSQRDQGSETFGLEVLGLVEINADERIVANVAFDPDDIDAAFEELDARYVAGEAAAHSDVWAVISDACAALNRRKLPSTTADWVNIDHRRLAPASDLPAYLRATWELSPQSGIYIEAVHRLTYLGAVVTHVVHGTSQDGFDAEWRFIDVTTVDDDLISRSEVFDEADLDAALARFDELHAQARRLENTASRVTERVLAYAAARDWEAMARMLAADYSSDDRRRVVNAGIRHGRDAEIENFRAAADIGFTDATSSVIATRGERLVLSRLRGSQRDQRPETFGIDMLGVIESNADERIAATVVFDPDDIDAAFEELDARYVAGEAAAHSQVWSATAQGYAALNRKEVPSTTSDWVTVDHRVRETFEAGDLTDYIRSGWDIAPDVKMYIEAVHRLSNLGAVVTHAAYGTSPEGFDAEWRMVGLLVFGGDDMNRCELFEEADLDAALARFDELSRPPVGAAALERRDPNLGAGN